MPLWLLHSVETARSRYETGDKIPSDVIVLFKTHIFVIFYFLPFASARPFCSTHSANSDLGLSA